MPKIEFADLLSEESSVECRVGMASTNNIDKSGVVYHVITPSWEILSGVIRTLNSNVAKYARNHMPERLDGWGSVFAPDPAYVLVDSMDYLFFLGKYVFDNQQRLKEEGKSVPDSCFWMFEKNYFPEPYRADIYQKLFGMSPADLYSIYKNKTSAEVRLLSKQLFRDWTAEDNRRLFIRNR